MYFCHRYLLITKNQYNYMKKIIAMLSLALAAGTTFAVPAKQAKKTLTLADGTQVTAIQMGDEHVTYEGKKKGIILLVQFPNQKFEAGHDNAYYKMVANEKGLTHEDGYVGSVSDYFLSQSNGKFEFDFDIAGPYTLSHTTSYYGKNDGANIDKKVGYMIQ